MKEVTVFVRRLNDIASKGVHATKDIRQFKYIHI